MHDKPIIEIGKFERTRTFDDLTKGINESLVQRARGGIRQEPYYLVAVVLRRVCGEETQVTQRVEYGDDDAYNDMKLMCRQIRRTKLLKKGESVRVAMYNVTGLEEIKP